MRTAASGLSEAVPQGYIHQSSHKRQAEYVPFQCRQAGTGMLRKAHRGHETGTGHNGTPKRGKVRFLALSKSLIAELQNFMKTIDFLVLLCYTS